MYEYAAGSETRSERKDETEKDIHLEWGSRLTRGGGKGGEKKEERKAVTADDTGAYLYFNNIRHGQGATAVLGLSAANSTVSQH